MCDACNNESGGTDVGVAAAVAAPVSLMWCNECLAHNATARFIVETWLFSEFWSIDGEEVPDMPVEPPSYPLAEWTEDMTLWMGKDRGYVTVKELYPELWKDAYTGILKERQEDERSDGDGNKVT